MTHLADLNEPLFRLIREVSETGKESAQTMYGKDGWVLHHNTDIWRVTGGIDKATSGMWMTGGAWVSSISGNIIFIVVTRNSCARLILS